MSYDKWIYNFHSVNPKEPAFENVYASNLLHFLLVLLNNVSIDANSVDTDQTAPARAV